MSDSRRRPAAGPGPVPPARRLAPPDAGGPRPVSFLGRLRSRIGGGSRGRVADAAGRFFFDGVLPDDTYLVSFPRSGNTYLRHLMAALLLDRSPTPSEVQDLVPDVHRAPPGWRPSTGHPVIAKSHAPAADVPARIVYLVRDGRAALLSYHRYLRQRGQPAPPTADAMLDWEEVWPCRWHDHVSGWLRCLEDRPDALVVRYEDLVADPAGVLGRVAALAGLDVREGALRRAVERSTRASMRRTEAAGVPGALNFVGMAAAPWKDAFGAAALARFEIGSGDLLRRLGYPLVASGRG